VRYVALLRAINLAGHNRISMAELRDVFASIGAEQVTTYVQSGNVVFDASGRAKKVAAAAEAEISTRLGLDIAVLIRTRKQLAGIVAANPFASKEASRLYLTFLQEPASAERVRALDPGAGAQDEFQVHGREIYLHFPGGYGRSKLSNAYFEKQLGVVATTRNWKTVSTLAELAAG
jgi:uncharacterized protein (DUF1697 family)